MILNHPEDVFKIAQMYDKDFYGYCGDTLYFSTFKINIIDVLNKLKVKYSIRAGVIRIERSDFTG